MPQLLIIRPVHYLPGKREQAMQWARETEPVRRRWGMLSQVLVQGIADRNEHLFVQIWESPEAYNKWKASPDRARLVKESQRLVAYDPTRLYEVI